MDEIYKLLPSLPSWITIPIVFLTIALSLVPRIYGVFGDLTARSREYKRENERLTLLKLRYEIEALKKDKNLPDLPDGLSVRTPPQASAASDDKQLNFLTRFLYGASGAAIPAILTGVVSTAHFHPGPVEPGYWVGYWVGFAIGVLIFGCFVGLVSAAILRRRTTRLVCFLVGLSIVLLISSFTREITAPDTKPPHTQAPIKPANQ
jgi:hypothetical protein